MNFVKAMRLEIIVALITIAVGIVQGWQSRATAKFMSIIGLLIVLQTSNLWMSWNREKQLRLSGAINAETVLSASEQKYPTLQVGRSEVYFQYAGEQGKPLFNIFEGNYIKIEEAMKKIQVSTVVRNKNGSIIALIEKNEWKILPSPLTFDRNYSNNALEVIDDQGNVVLQIVLMGKIVQLQGTFYGIDGRCFILAQMGKDALMRLLPPNSKMDVHIRPMFKYPSNKYLGQLVTN